MKKAFPRRQAKDDPQKPAYDVFLALVSLCARFDKPWVTVTQRKLMERVEGTTGRRMSRRTLCRHLLALERRSLIKRQRRHQSSRSGKLQLRATLYTFGTKGQLWIKRLRDAGAIPIGRLAVPKMAQSQKPSINRKCPHCGQIIHSANRGPRDKRGGTRRPPTARRAHRAR